MSADLLVRVAATGALVYAIGTAAVEPAIRWLAVLAGAL